MREKEEYWDIKGRKNGKLSNVMRGGDSGKEREREIEKWSGK